MVTNYFLGIFAEIKIDRIHSLLSCSEKMHHHHDDTRVNSSTNWSTSCEKILIIGPEIFELKWGR